MIVMSDKGNNNFSILVLSLFFTAFLGAMYCFFVAIPTSTPYSTGYFPSYIQKIKIGDSLPYPHKMGMYEDRVYTGYFDNDTIVVCQLRTNYFIHIGGDLYIQNNSGNYLYHFVSVEKPSGNLVIEMISTD
jgi:hypothetical protein